MPIKQIEESFLNLEEQIEILTKLPEDSVAAIDNLSKSSNSSDSPLLLKEKRLGKLSHSNSRSCLNEEEAHGGRLQEMVSHYKSLHKDAGSAESDPPSPNSTSSKSSKTIM